MLCSIHSISLFIGAPPTITSYALPPNMLSAFSLMRCFTFLFMTGILSSKRILLFCISGKTCFLIIFSTTSGTVTTSEGLISAIISVMRERDGSRVRKWMWQPLIKPNRNSTTSPYMCAIGKVLTMLLPVLALSPSFSMTQSTLLLIAQYGNMTPFELPVVPLV